MGWKELRPIQVDAIRIVLTTDRPVVISAETAAGKTEAAFLPVLSRISSEPTGSVRAMYVGPLRALINDQFRRVEDLCNYLDMPVCRWHGDVGGSNKNRLLSTPGGILLITPESLESLFVNRSSQLLGLLGGLRFVVIDELHAFLGSERGLHLQSLLARLRHGPTAGRPPFRTLALSATLGDLSAAREFLDRDDPQAVTVIESPPEGKELRFRLHAYLAGAQQGEAGRGDTSDQAEVAPMRLLAEDIVEHCRERTNLVFTNSKGDLEIYADLCREIVDRERLPVQFLVHHGSLSKEIREDTEVELKSGRPCTVLCSSTLELGIDIGDVRMVGQVGPPWSAVSFKQRLGRSGRRDGQPRVGRLYVVCRDPGSEGSLLDRLHLELVQSIAVTELLLTGWVEPLGPALCDLSTLTHQIISVIAETGGLRAAGLHERLCRSGPFRAIEPPVFASLLRALGEKDVVEQTPEGDLILGLLGERIRAERDFYAAFQNPAEFAVLHGQQAIGTLPLRFVPNVGEHLILAGRRWKITLVELERAEIHVSPAAGRKRPLFLGGPGEVHNRIRQHMREVLTAQTEYAYLCPTAAGLLACARAAAHESGVTIRPLLRLATRSALWFTWIGTRAQRTLLAQLARLNVEACDRGVAIEIAASLGDCWEIIAQLMACEADALVTAAHVQPKERRKYDSLLPPGLLDRGIAADLLDVPAAHEACRVALAAGRDGFGCAPSRAEAGDDGATGARAAGGDGSGSDADDGHAT
ncbi:MAG TPA: DEAD/DEAH box helicase [Phycisphaerae bacterium]|nr:DEAD/DEAH box helicase [Phycisphaerae bacterium]HNU45347.1 DEAD/DEAH box helicase [Phycisphaerae bacterium]